MHNLVLYSCILHSWIVHTIAGVAAAIGHEVIRLTIPWPSGIIIDSIVDNEGRVFRFGRLQLNAVQMRPEWNQVYLMEKFLPKELCEDIIARAERHSQLHGWSKARHIDYLVRPTKDHAVRSIYDDTTVGTEEYRQLVSTMLEQLAPRLSAVYSLHNTAFDINDLFITKYEYDSSSTRGLGPHTDKSPWSFVVALNGPNEHFTGGGTYVFSSQQVYSPPQGGVTFFNGQNLHAAVPVNSGTRYILAGFVEEYHRNDSHSPSSFAAGTASSTSGFGNEVFYKYYDPLYDGHAGAAGFHSGDRIIALQVCTLAVRPSPASAADIDLVADMNAYGNMAAAVTAASIDDGGENKNLDNQVRIDREMVFITGDMSDADWLAAATSCEQLAPGEPAVMDVMRSTASILSHPPTR